MARALDAAHARGLVHRDVKPANVLLDPSAGDAEGVHAYLTDFGLTKQSGRRIGLTRAGSFLGTPAYMAPEQIQGGDVDGRADAYSLAAVAFEALTGQVPFKRDQEFAVAMAHVQRSGALGGRIAAGTAGSRRHGAGPGLAKDPRPATTPQRIRRRPRARRIAGGTVVARPLRLGHRSPRPRSSSAAVLGLALVAIAGLALGLAARGPGPEGALPSGRWPERGKRPPSRSDTDPIHRAPFRTRPSDDVVRRTASDHDVPAGDCEATSPAFGRWSQGAREVGSVACYLDGIDAVIEWTHDDEAMLVRTTFPYSDVKSAVSWWVDTRDLLGSTQLGVAAPFPSTAEAALISRLPDDLNDDCGRGSYGPIANDPPVKPIASIRCAQTPGPGATQLEVRQSATSKASRPGT